MKKTVRILTLSCTLAAMCAACGELADEMNNGIAQIELTARIGEPTRAYDTTWEPNDEIGLYVTTADGSAFKEYSNYPYVTHQGSGIGQFFPKEGYKGVTLPSDGSELSIMAYYPYEENLVNNTFEVKNWNDSKIDLMLSDTKKVSMTNKSTSLKFYHQFSKIVLNISANTEESLLTNEDLKGMVITTSANMNCAVSVDVRTGNATRGSVQTSGVNFKVNSDGTHGSVILCPDKLSDNDTNQPSLDRKITFRAAGKTFTWNLNDPSFVMERGNSYTWNVTLKGDGLVEAILEATIAEWKDNLMEEEIKLEQD